MAQTEFDSGGSGIRHGIYYKISSYLALVLRLARLLHECVVPHASSLSPLRPPIKIAVCKSKSSSNRMIINSLLCKNTAKIENKFLLYSVGYVMRSTNRIFSFQNLFRNTSTFTRLFIVNYLLKKLTCLYYNYDRCRASIVVLFSFYRKLLSCTLDLLKISP